MVTSCEVKIHKVAVTNVRNLSRKTHGSGGLIPQHRAEATATEAQQTTPPPEVPPPLEGKELAGNCATSLPQPELRVMRLQPPATRTATSVSPPDGERARKNQTSIQVSG